MTDSARSDSPPLTKEQRKERHLGGVVVTERKISYQILIDLDIQIKAKRNPSIKGLLQIFLHMTEVSTGWD